jgi:23S rRNA 5-hydroxycytidine C2501 synthase
MTPPPGGAASGPSPLGSPPPALGSRLSALTPPGAVELLAPARDLECGRAAILCGADAVYIGAQQFGARDAAGNTLEDIARLVELAHRYWARVYVAVNTLLTDEELPAATRLAKECHAIGVDALIIQDVGLLECDLPPLPLIASTQMHNHTPARVAFLEQVGFRRAILARELSLDEIRAIRAAAPSIELESFVHGALCVCYSGQCAWSYALGGRSGNRGQCAQPCRKPYTLTDARGRVLAERSHLLSLKDLSLAEELPALLDAGVTSFKIEGRLKDAPYAANIVAHYRARLDAALAPRGLSRSSSGTANPGFAPDPAKTFNRGYTTYFLHGKSGAVADPRTPKMVGEAVGAVAAVRGNEVTVPTRLALHPGDGLCFFDGSGALRGTLVNGVRGSALSVQSAAGIRPGTRLHRNHDHTFLAAIQPAKMDRRIAVTLRLRNEADGLALVATDEDGVQARSVLAGISQPARDAAGALAVIRRQLQKTGQTVFACPEVVIEATPVPFLSLSALNGMRREALDALLLARAAARPCATGGLAPTSDPYPEDALDYRGNVLNAKAEAFYRRHGVARIEPAAESGLDLAGRTIMTTRYCPMRELELCDGTGIPRSVEQPLALSDDEGRRFRLELDCPRCEMSLILE